MERENEEIGKVVTAKYLKMVKSTYPGVHFVNLLGMAGYNLG
jgi:hypothetical protein